MFPAPPSSGPDGPSIPDSPPGMLRGTTVGGFSRLQAVPVCFKQKPDWQGVGGAVSNRDHGLGGAHRNLVFDPGQLLLSLGQLGIGLLQGLPLGGHVAVDLIEAHDVDAPGAQASSSRGLGADELRVKGGVALVGPGRKSRVLSRAVTGHEP